MLRNPRKDLLHRFSPQTLGLGAVVLASITWAIAANVANSLFLVGVQPLELAGASTTIATFGFAILDSLLGRAQAQPINRQQFASGLVLVGLVGADYLAIQRLPVAVAIVLLFTAPALVVLWSAFTSRRAPASPVLLALLLSAIGVVLVSNILSSNLQRVDWLGIAVGLTTAVLFAAYIILIEKLSSVQLSATRETVGVMLKMFTVASLVWLAYQFTQGVPQALLEPQNIPKVIYMGLSGTLLPYLLFFWCIQRVQAQRAAIVATLEPFVAGVLAWIWFGQTLTFLQIVGGLLIIVAITWMQVKTFDLASSK